MTRDIGMLALVAFFLGGGVTIGWLLAHWKLTAPMRCATCGQSSGLLATHYCANHCGGGDGRSVYGPHMALFYADRIAEFTALHGFPPTEMYVSQEGMDLLGPIIEVMFWNRPVPEPLLAWGVWIRLKPGVDLQHPLLWHDALNPKVEWFQAKAAKACTQP